MQVRRARAEEGDILCALYREVKGKLNAGSTWTEDYSADADILADIAASALFCLEEDGKILGACATEADEVKDLVPCDRTAASVEISRVCIRPDRQGEHLAGKLVAGTLECLRREGYAYVRLLVSPGNLPAYRTYLHCGFRVIGEADKYDVHWLCCERALG